MRLMDFVFLRHLLPKATREKVVRPWNQLLARELLFHEARFYRQFIRPGDLVFDIGANEGSKTAAFLRLGARVIAVEPNPACIAQMRRRESRNISEARIVVEQVAVGAEKGRLIFQTGADDSTITSASPEFVAASEAANLAFGNTFDAPVVTADDLIQKHGEPQFVKIDVEGMDPQVLGGLHFRPRALSFEFNTAPSLFPNTTRCLHEVERLGFIEANFTASGTPRLRLRSWVPLAELSDQISQWAEGRVTFGDVIVR